VGDCSSYLALLMASQVFGIMTFCYSGHGVFPAIRASMRQPEQFSSVRTSLLVLVQCTCLNHCSNCFYVEHFRWLVRSVIRLLSLLPTKFAAANGLSCLELTAMPLQVLNVAFLVVAAFCTFIAAAGYYMYGPAVADVVIFNLPPVLATACSCLVGHACGLWMAA
jgi:hypothetical protein